jgi:hypothetical protein
LSLVLDQGDTVPAGGVTCSNEDGVAFASDEDILFIVDTYPVGGEDGYSACICNFADTEE